MSELIEDTQEDKIKLLVFFRGYRIWWFLPLVSLDHYCFTLYTHIEILAVLVINNRKFLSKPLIDLICKTITLIVILPAYSTVCSDVIIVLHQARGLLPIVD